MTLFEIFIVCAFLAVIISCSVYIKRNGSRENLKNLIMKEIDDIPAEISAIKELESYIEQLTGLNIDAAIKKRITAFIQDELNKQKSNLHYYVGKKEYEKLKAK